MLKSSLILETLKGHRGNRVPFWFMRQAGRYLPEYREIRAKHSMLDVVRTPELATRVTLQPLERFPLDAAIIFADILTPLIGMGVKLDFIKGEGPHIYNPVRTLADVEALKVPAPEENVGYTLDAIRMVTREIDSKGIPLFGFSGAPFTLAAYMIEGEGGAQLSILKNFMRSETKAWNLLQEKLIALVAEYLVAQVEAGASALQLFDSWVGALSPADFRTYVKPGLQQIFSLVKAKVDVPLIYFSTGTTGLYREFKDLGADAIGVDWRVSLQEASQLLGEQVPLQGNLDPSLLLGPWQPIETEVLRIAEEGKELSAWVFNLGHGILPGTPVDNIEKLVNLLRTVTY